MRLELLGSSKSFQDLYNNEYHLHVRLISTFDVMVLHLLILECRSFLGASAESHSPRSGADLGVPQNAHTE